MIDFRDASARDGEFRMLAAITAHVDQGAGLVLRGANGAGKTTALRLVTGQLAASDGEVLVAGRRPNQRDRVFRRRVAAMIGLPPFARDLTVGDQLTLQCVTWGSSVNVGEERASAVADELGLRGLLRRFPHELSSGQLQLAGLALLFARPSNVLVLDEPEQRLDADRLSLVIAALRLRMAAGATVLLASHSERIADELGARSLTLSGQM